MKSFCKLSCFVLVLCLVTGMFAGCGNSGGSQPTESESQKVSSGGGGGNAATESSKEAVEITVCTQSSQWANAFKKLTPDFEKENNVKVNFVDVSFGVMYENLMTKLMSNSDAYDMIWHDSMWMPEFTKKGFLEDLTSYLSNTDVFIL